jgi:hypothetical protein
MAQAVELDRLLPAFMANRVVVGGLNLNLRHNAHK